MKRNIVLLFFMFVFMFLTSCSTNETTPNETFNRFTKLWENNEFTNMYNMLTEESMKQYPKNQFVDRFEKIYSDLDANVKVTFTEMKEKEIETATKKGTATIPFHVEMDTIAGPISFDYEVTLLLQEVEDKKIWLVNWDRGFIHPDMKNGGEMVIQTIPAKRGEILDRNKMPLAMNDLVWEVGVIPEKLENEPEQAKEEIARLLNMSVESIDRELNAAWVEPHLFVPLKNVPKTEESRLNQLWQIDGVQGREVTGRVYPLGKSAAHLVGYIGKITSEELEKMDTKPYTENDMIGKRGLEQLYEDHLQGEHGVKVMIKTEDDEEIIIADKEVKNGESLQLTIDANVQEKVYEAYEGNIGTTAVIHPKTGETLALVSSPAFDPNDLIYGVTKSKWDRLQNDPDEPLVNRFASTYAPGSVMKPITAAIGLNNGTIDPDEGIEINGLTWSNGKGWGDYKVRRVSTSNGPVDLHDALVRSDNIYFAMKSVEMGSNAYIKGLKNFGLDEELPFIYPITPSSISSDGNLDNEVLLANTSYGQGEVQFSSLHIALAYTPFLNKGNMLKPTLLLSEETEQIWKKEMISSKQAKHIQKALRDVVQEGTAKMANDANFPISGKTGTAELKLASEQSGKENGWFVAYPTKDQDVLIAMMIENTHNKGGTGYVVEKVTKLLSELQ